MQVYVAHRRQSVQDPTLAVFTIVELVHVQTAAGVSVLIIYTNLLNSNHNAFEISKDIVEAAV